MWGYPAAQTGRGWDLNEDAYNRLLRMTPELQRRVVLDYNPGDEVLCFFRFASGASEDRLRLVRVQMFYRCVVEPN